MDILFAIEFAAGQGDLGGINDNYVIPGINVGSIYGLMLSAKDSGYLRSKTAEHHSVCVYNVPLPLEGFALCHIGFHGVPPMVV